jgi:Carboxypeptidase regulatory-like domain
MQKREAKSQVSSKWLALCMSVMLCLILRATSLAQSDNAQISGFVKDPTGAAVPGAAVVIKNEGSNYERTTKTNDSGYYTVTALPPGFYTVTVEAGGFKKFQQTKKKLDPSIASTVDVELTLGEVTETIEVVASVSSVQSETATVGKLIESSQIALMQLNGRNPVLLAGLKPGVRSNSNLSGLNFGLTSGGFNINGGRSQDNLITYDGAVGIRTRSNGTSIGTADVDAVQEVQILTANYGAEYGRSAGGQIRIVTKSGTQAFHGTFYEFLRNSALDANSWTRNQTIGNTAVSSKPEAQRYNQFGYSLSGPIPVPGYKNKLFWLFGQEWVRRRREETSIITVPSLAMRRGDFSELLNPSNQFFSRAVVVNDPLTGQPFAGNIIPTDRLSANGLALLRSYPQPTPGFQTGTNNFVQARPTEADQRKESISIDWNPSERHQVRGRILNYNFIETSAFRAGTDRAPQIIDRPNNTLSLSWTFTISPTLVNEALVTTSADRVHIYVDTRGNTYQRSNYGINYPYLFPAGKEITDKIPTVEIQNFATVDGGPYPSASSGPIYDFSDNLTKIKGNHTFKFGGLFERAGQNDFDQINVSGVPGGTNNQNGRFVFNNARTGAPTSGLAVANTALGLFSTYAELGTRAYTPYRGHMFEWFVQDSWKVKPNLRLEFGLRHSIIQPYYSLWRNMIVFDPKFYDPSKTVTQDPATGFILGTTGDRYNGLVIPGDGFPDSAKGRFPIATSGEFDYLFRGVSKEYSKIQKRDFQPRFGIAYSLNEKSVIRAGAGRFMTRLGVSDSVFLGGQSPFQPTSSVTNGSVDAPGGASSVNFPLIITTQDPEFKNPTAYTWNVTFERELGFKTTVEVGYVGRRGLRGQRERNLNQLQPGTLQKVAAENPGRTINVDTLRPYKGFGTIRTTNNDANSLYNGLQIGVNRRFVSGFSYGVAYTYAKSEDDGSAQRDVVPNAFDVSTLWGPSSFDNRHTLALNYIYALPLFRDKARLSGKVLGGWQITGVAQFQTGTPVTVGTGDDFAGVGGLGNLDSNPGDNKAIQIWNVSGDPKLSRGDRQFSSSNSDKNLWFRTTNPDGTSLFTAPAAGTFTTQRNRNLIYGAGFQNWNLGIFKGFQISENHRLQFRCEMFNFINHPNWGGDSGGPPDTRPRQATFGKIVTKGNQRQLQMSLRYSF